MNQLYSLVKKENQILGICLGMQLLLDGSEEGNSKGLGLIRGKVIRFKTKRFLTWDGIS